MAFRYRVSHSIKYGRYKDWRKVIDAFIGIIEHNEDILRKLLDLPEHLTIEFAPIRKGHNGVYRFMSQSIVIAPRGSAKFILQTLMHELVHAEQYKTGRLNRRLNHNLRRHVHVWKGEEIDSRSTLLNLRKNYDKYYNLPWEKEAFGREKELAKMFLEEATVP